MLVLRALILCIITSVVFICQQREARVDSRCALIYRVFYLCPTNLPVLRAMFRTLTFFSLFYVKTTTNQEFNVIDITLQKNICPTPLSNV